MPIQYCINQTFNKIFFFSATASLASVHFSEAKQKKSEHVSRPTDNAAAGNLAHVAPRGKSQPSKAVSLHGEPWYNEVVELRRQAHDYKVTIVNMFKSYIYVALRVIYNEIH